MNGGDEHAYRDADALVDIAIFDSMAPGVNVVQLLEDDEDPRRVGVNISRAACSGAAHAMASWPAGPDISITLSSHSA